MNAQIDTVTASADIDLAAFASNIAVIKALVEPAAVMVVVKADAYGHGMIPCAVAAREVGVEWLGVATPEEALTLRTAGDTGRILAWLYGVDSDLTPLIAADVDVSVQSVEQISRVSAAAGTTERRAQVHLKVDTGLSRNGAERAIWTELFASAVEAESSGAIEVVGLWSHLAAADEPGHPSIEIQSRAFAEACDQARESGLAPTRRHLANSAGALTLPDARLDLVRVGIAAYGIDPAPGITASAGVELQPVMTLRGQLVNLKQIETGAGVSYGWTWIAPEPTRVGLVPLGYADGIPRHASDRAEVSIGGARAAIRGRVCMDQFVVDLSRITEYELGSEIVLFSTGDGGSPTANDWAGWCDTIGYEIVTRIGARVPRRYFRGTEPIAAPAFGKNCAPAFGENCAPAFGKNRAPTDQET